MNGQRTKFKTIDCDGEHVDIFVDSDDGKYSVQLDGLWITLPALQPLEKKVRERIRDRAKIAIEASLVDTYEDSADCEDIVITGRHAGNNNILYRTGQGPFAHTEQLRGESGRILVRVTPAEKRELKALVKAIDTAQKAVQAWKHARRMNVGEAFAAARGKKATA